METIALQELTDNECLVSCCLGVFENFQSEMMLVLGSARDLVLHPQTFSAAFITVMRIEGERLVTLHKTAVEALPLALSIFYGKLLVGIGKTIRLYEVGAKKLLRKSENKLTFPLSITHIRVHDERIFACDVSESFTVLRYNKEDKQIYAVADDVIPRWITDCCILDHDTIAAVDKFENVVVSRVPPSCYDDVEQDASSIRYKWEVGYLGGAYFKLDQVAHFYLGELATSIQRAELTDGGASVLLYGTTMGSLGALMPITRKEDVEFFVHLELYMRLEAPPICGREHLAFRSFYAPVSNTVDGDLCELFSSLSPDRQHAISEELKKTPTEVLKKLEDFRNRIL